MGKRARLEKDCWKRMCFLRQSPISVACRTQTAETNLGKGGFTAQDYPLNLKVVSDEESAKGSWEWYKSDGFPKQLPRDIVIDTPDWREIFADYTMVCEL
jgi:hypothetical protein